MFRLRNTLCLRNTFRLRSESDESLVIYVGDFCVCPNKIVRDLRQVEAVLKK